MLKTARKAGGGVFVDLLWSSGLARRLVNGDKKFTLIVPTDDAFASLPASMHEKLKNACFLRKVLAHHIINGAVRTGSRINQQTVPTMMGAPIFFGKMAEVNRILYSIITSHFYPL